MALESSPNPKTLSIPAASQRKGWLQRGLRPLLLAGVVSAIIMQIVALSPSSIEEARDNSAPLDPEVLIPKEKTILATGIPRHRVPEYSVDQFNYVSTHESVREWNLIADRADMYNVEKIVHARTARAFLYDSDGRVTVVTGKEAKYLMASPTPPTPGTKGKDSGQRDLEVFGDVKTVFPDGFEVQSEYMRYRPDQKTIEIPMSYATSGHGQDTSSRQILSFTSQGMHYSMKESEIILPREVRVMVEKPGNKSSLSQRTVIESDRCVIDRSRQLAKFTMDPARPLKERFVRVTQPTLFSKGRRGDLNYGNLGTPTPTPSAADSSPARLLNYIVLYEDVLLKETGKSSLRYATAGRADFDGTRDIVLLTEFPQVYQDQDTVTGDRILLHRDTDIVEVEHSNSFSEGQGN